MSAKVAVVISSFDGYHDAWGPMAALMNRYWADREWPAYLICNDRSDNFENIETLALGKDAGWASNLITGLDHIQNHHPELSHVLYLQEDYFLQAPVDQSRLQRLVGWAEKSDVGYIRLAGAPSPDTRTLNEHGVGRISEKAPYRCSLQAALWNVQTLRSLLVPGESGWDMEGAGTERSRTLSEAFYATPMNAPILNYYFYTGIMKGKWVPGALRLCRREGIDVDVSHRDTHPEWPFIMKQIRYSPPIWAMRKLLRRARGKAA